MKTKPIRIRLHDSDLEAIKKRGVAGGKNISETIRDLIHSGLENRSESHHVSGPGIDPETIRKEVDLAIRAGLEPAMKTINLIRAEIAGLGPIDLPGTGTGNVTPDPTVARFMAEKVARIDALLIGVSSKISGSNVGDHGDRMKQANVMAQSEIKKLFGG